jgi:inner membrane protease subunit 1
LLISKILKISNYFKTSRLVNSFLSLHSAYLYIRPFIWFLFVNEFIFDFYLLEGESMLPTFDAYGNIVILEKITKSLSRGKKLNYKTGEVVCVLNPINCQMKLCKRILYREGEEVPLQNGNIVIVPKNHLWVEGDNKSNSIDSRRFGPIPESLILGRVIFQIWPIIRLV